MVSFKNLLSSDPNKNQTQHHFWLSLRILQNNTLSESSLKLSSELRRESATEKCREKQKVGGKERGERSQTFTFVLSYDTLEQNIPLNIEEYYLKNLEGEIVVTLQSLFTCYGKIYLSVWELL